MSVDLQRRQFLRQLETLLEALPAPQAGQARAALAERAGDLSDAAKAETLTWGPLEALAFDHPVRLWRPPLPARRALTEARSC